MNEDIVVPIAFFVTGVMVVLISVGAAVIHRFNLHETVRVALRQGQPLDAEAIKALGAPRRKNGKNDLKSGLILIAVALGFVVFGVLLGGTVNVEDGDPSLARIFAGIAAIPAFIGVVLTGFGIAQARNRSGQPD